MCYLILLFNTWNENIVIIQLSCRKPATKLLQIRSQVVLTLVICYTIIQLLLPGDSNKFYANKFIMI